MTTPRKSPEEGWSELKRNRMVKLLILFHIPKGRGRSLHASSLQKLAYFRCLHACKLACMRHKLACSVLVFAEKAALSRIEAISGVANASCWKERARTHSYSLGRFVPLSLSLRCRHTLGIN